MTRSSSRFYILNYASRKLNLFCDDWCHVTGHLSLWPLRNNIERLFLTFWLFRKNGFWRNDAGEPNYLFLFLILKESRESSNCSWRHGLKILCRFDFMKKVSIWVGLNTCPLDVVRLWLGLDSKISWKRVQNSFSFRKSLKVKIVVMSLRKSTLPFDS